MGIEKHHLEFHAIDMETEGWRSPTGYPPDIEQKILAGGLDEVARKGSRTRLLRFRPGAHTTAPFVHEYAEEVYLISGDLIVGEDRPGEAAVRFAANTYACRPAGVLHGPFRSETGCLLLEFHYFEPPAS